MKMFEEINHMRKDYVYEYYTRIVEDFKDYEKITKVKMLSAIYKVYDNPDNIVDICTTRELKYLKMVLEDKVNYSIKEILLNGSKYKKDKYYWESRTLMNKFLLDHERKIPDEIIDKVKQALKRVNWGEKKKIDDLNELLVSYCKIQGSTLLVTLCEIASDITSIDPNIIWTHMLNNKLFNYYVFITFKDFDGLGEKLPLAIFTDYYELEDELAKERKKQGLAGNIRIDIRMFKTLFYNDFDINNPKIKKFVDELESLPFFFYRAIELVKEYALLNIDRKDLKEAIKSVPSLKYIDLTHFFKTLDEAMDEMPSGALNGFTPNEAKKIKEKSIDIQINKAKKYVKQQNACLSKKDAKLFYKIYFGLLEFTNKKYKVNEHVKIYKQEGINPYEIRDIVDKYWENKEEVTKEFCTVNPYKFNEEELKLASEFKKGIRDMFIISRYELEYTAFMNEDKIYMVKGLNDNIDNIISYDNLPTVSITSIIPFKDCLVYDGLLLEIAIKMGNEFYEMIESEYDSLMKYYHL